MSIKVMSAVWDKSSCAGGELIVMLALADWANEEGEHIFPSIATLAKKSRMSERAVQYILRKLESKGEITVDRQSHRTHNGQLTNEYCINLEHLRGAEIAGVQELRGAKNDAEGCKKAPQGVKPTAPNPSVDSSGDPLDIFPEAGVDKPAEPQAKAPDQESLPFKAPAANEVSAPKEKIASGASEHKCSSNYQPLFSALATLTGLNVRLKASLIGRAARELDSIGATVADVEKVRDWWYANDWRGLRRQAPTLEQVKEAWDRALNPGLVPEPVPVPLRNNGGSYMPGKVMTPAAIRNRSMGFDV